MSKKKFIEKSAQEAPPLFSFKRALEDYYGERPDQAQRDRIKGLVEIFTPSVIATPLGSLRKDIGPGIAAYGALPIGALIHTIGRAGRRQKAMQEMGIETDLLGTYVEPKSPSAKKRYTF